MSHLRDSARTTGGRTRSLSGDRIFDRPEPTRLRDVQRIRVAPKVLIVDDDEVIADGMARHVRAAGFDPVWVSNGRTALARLRYERADVCVLDLMLPELAIGA